MENITGKENFESMQHPTSPGFLKPKPLSLKRKPKRAIANIPLQELDVNASKKVNNCQNIGYLMKSPKKAFNPFRRGESKRKREVENFDDNSNSLLWQWTNNQVSSNSFKQVKSISIPSPVVPAIVDENAHSGFSETAHFPSLHESQHDQIKSKHKTLPVDWSLKTKIRLTSSKPFPWRSSFKTSEEASGTTGFVRCLHVDGKSKKQYSLDSSHGAKFYQQCLVWMHPSLPWMNLFPRTESHSLKNNSSSVTLDVAVQETLHSKWCDSFRSLYQLVRTCQCPYFYLCAPTFTILFRSSGVASILDLHAVISPTTKGFRKALREEGIEFTMPLCKDNDSGILEEETMDESFKHPAAVECVESNENSEKLQSETDANAVEDDDAEDWLESLGLSQENFPSLNKSKLQNKESPQIDHRPESLVYIEGSETQALVNFLLNFSSCTPKIGPMAGIPPTLLSPTAFLGATLHVHKIRHGKVKNGTTENDTVEIHGPLLPNTIHSLCHLFNSTQDGHFSAHLAPFDPTLAFAAFATQSTTVPSVFATENLKDCGLPETFVQQMCSKVNSGVVLEKVNAEDGLFTWT